MPRRAGDSVGTSDDRLGAQILDPGVELPAAWCRADDLTIDAVMVPGLGDELDRPRRYWRDHPAEGQDRAEGAVSDLYDMTAGQDLDLVGVREDLPLVDRKDPDLGRPVVE